MSPADPAPGAASCGAAQLGARLDRLPWSARHTTILLALGTGWLFDSFEVQLFSTAVGPLGDTFAASVTQRDLVLAVWLVGILLGALVGGPLTDRFGRRRLFVLTLVWYAAFTVLTGLSPTLVAVFVLRFLAALGVGAEYAIVNAAIAEFIPARTRGRAGVVAMAFWPAGAILAALFAFLLLHTAALAASVSWRYMFVLGGLLALVVLVFRRRIPESPRWLLARGRLAEADCVVRGLEAACHVPPAPRTRLPARGTDPPPVRLAVGELFRHHRGRLFLGASLDLAEAFGYYGLFALLSVVVLPEVGISQREIPLFFLVGNVAGLLGALTMSLFIDRIGRRAAVLGSYGLSALAVAVLAAATATGEPVAVMAAFVLANAAGTAAWTSAYPTFAELFPTHLRGAGVGLCVGAGRAGAIVGALLLPGLAAAIGPTPSYLLVVACWLIGVAAMAGYSVRGGVEAAHRSLEDLDPIAPALVLRSHA